jgi:uncharacterized protein (DUF4415 family)
MVRVPQRKSAPAGRRKAAAPAKARAEAPKAERGGRRKAEGGGADWASDLVFNVKEPKLAVSLRLDADVLRFFRGFGSGYQTRINEVLKAFMHARQRAGLPPGAEAGARMAAPKKAGRRARG